MAVDQAQQWLPDPAGKHQFRLHSDGQPTEWVSDDGSMTIDRLEPAPPAPPADGGAPAVASVQPGSTGWGSASNSQPAAPATPPVRPAGWYRNAANPSEVRYWDGSQWAVDQTVATSTPSSAPTPPVDSLADTGSVAPIAPSAASESAAPETVGGLDAPGRHSLGRSQTADADALANGAPTVSSVWAQPDVHGDQTPAPAPSPVAPVVSAAAPAPVVTPLTPPAEVAAPEPAAATPPAPIATMAADWYPDPSNRTRLRYWDGAGWTEHVMDEGPTPRA